MPVRERDYSVGVEEREADQKELVRLISFVLSDEHYCLKLTDVKEVVGLSPITKVPNTPDFIVGVTNLRGEVLSVLDIRSLFGLQKREITTDSRLIVTDIKEKVVGVLVDEIREAINVDEASIQPPLATTRAQQIEFTEGQFDLDGEVLILIDLEKLLGCEEIEQLKRR